MQIYNQAQDLTAHTEVQRSKTSAAALCGDRYVGCHGRCPEHRQVPGASAGARGHRQVPGAAGRCHIYRAVHDVIIVVAASSAQSALGLALRARHWQVRPVSQSQRWANSKGPSSQGRPYLGRGSWRYATRSTDSSESTSRSCARGLNTCGTFDLCFASVFSAIWDRSLKQCQHSWSSRVDASSGQ